MRCYFLSGLALSFAAALCGGCDRQPAVSSGEQVVRIEVGPGAQKKAQTALIKAKPGTTLEFGEGKFEFDTTLWLEDVSDVTIRGQGADKTMLSFARQQQGTGGEGLRIKCPHNVTVEDLAVEDAKGDAIKVQDTQNICLRRVRVEWTGGPKDTNGAYGLYPVLCTDVLIEDCTAIGASDAGIYVGQSENIIVRRNRCERNVAAIEIENSLHADVYENNVTDNSGGLLVFSLPDLPKKEGCHCRVFNNKVVANNHENFAPKGNIVATVPPGTGIMVMANHEVEVFNNTVESNDSTGLLIVSYLINRLPIKDQRYDPYCESIYVHGNKFAKNGKKPGGDLGAILGVVLGTPFTDIMYDGIRNEQKFVDGELPAPLRLRIRDNGDATFVNFDGPFFLNPSAILFGKKPNIVRDLKPYDGELAPLAPATIASNVRKSTKPAPAEVPPPDKLSDYGLFVGNGASQQPVAGVIPYDLNTPLFSDYTNKHRFVRLPAGAIATYKPDGAFDFPVGTVIAKTFAYPVDMRDPSQGERLIETRILKHEAEGWVGLPYIWNAEQTEATLDVAGGTVDVAWIDAAGAQRTNNYIIPNVNQCKGCHKQADVMELLGPKARQLNREFAYAEGKENQLAHWTRVGALSGAPRPDDAPRLAVWDDPSTGTVDARARAWLEINCAHCHNPQGAGRNSGLDLTIAERDPTMIGVLKPPVAAGRGSGGLSYDIVPGHPDKSIVIFRTDSTDAGAMMPELGKRMVHSEGVELLRQWIAEMPDKPQPAGAAGQ